jgi:sortase (surface protein transpeptidase)
MTTSRGRLAGSLCLSALILAGCSGPARTPVPTIAYEPPSSPRLATSSPSSSDPSTIPSSARGEAPVRIDIPAIDVESRVTSVGTTDRVLDIPRKPWVVGWWADGVGSGSDHGTTVLAAHLTTVRYGDGPFVRAPDLVPGDAMTLTDAEGRNRAYTVETVKTYIKTALPYERLFTQTGPPRVVLVTCGGTYRPETGHWDSNVVVTFVPRSGSS